MTKSLFSLTLLILAATGLAAQEASAILIGERQTIQSQVLGESREIMLSAPEKVFQKLPLILVFDGESLFAPVVSAAKFMAYSSEIPQIPEALIVGIPNTKRHRDMPVPQQYGNTKGEANFMKFLTDELIPFLNTKYKLNGHTIAVGHSQGGLFVSYLLAKSPEVFPWVVSLDAPLTIDVKTIKLKENLSAKIREPGTKARYFSGERMYGWDNEWAEYMTSSLNALRLNYPGETHESMPFKSIYDGLSFLYKDFAPDRKDLKLSELQEHFRSVSAKYGYTYEVPFKVLTAAANRRLSEGRKKDVADLIRYAEEKYEPTSRTASIKTESEKITAEPPSIIDSLLALSKPSTDQVKPYVGRWTGTLVVPEGQNMPLDIDVKINNDTASLTSALPWDLQTRVEPAFFSISSKGELLIGRRNSGGGLVVIKAVVNSKGQLTGEERLIGFKIPADAPAEAKTKLNFIINNPNTFTLTKMNTE